MKIYYHPETDSLSFKLRTGEAGVVGEIMGEDLNENVVLHRDDAGSSRIFSGPAARRASWLIGFSELTTQ